MIETRRPVHFMAEPLERQAMIELRSVITVEVPTEDGRYAAIDFRRSRLGYWTVEISDELIVQAPEGLTASLVLAFRQLATEPPS